MEFKPGAYKENGAWKGIAFDVMDLLKNVSITLAD